jgi:hypothetical protein
VEPPAVVRIEPANIGMVGEIFIRELQLLEELQPEPIPIVLKPIECRLNVQLGPEEDNELHQRFGLKILALTSSQIDPRSGFLRYSSRRLSTLAICSGVIGISSGLDARKRCAPMRFC